MRLWLAAMRQPLDGRKSAMRRPNHSINVGTGGDNNMRKFKLASIRRGLLAGAMAATALSFAGSDASEKNAVSPRLTAVDRSAHMSTAEIQSWLDQKDSWGPAYTAGPGWKKFMAFIHAELNQLHMADIVDHPFPYTRWYTTEFPDKSGWSLMSDGKPVEVASYGTQSGSTGPSGVTAPMVLYDLNLPVAQRPPLSALAGRIVVVRQQPFASLGTPQRVPLGVPAPTSPPTYCGNPPACKPA